MEIAPLERGAISKNNQMWFTWFLYKTSPLLAYRNADYNLSNHQKCSKMVQRYTYYQLKELWFYV